MNSDSSWQETIRAIVAEELERIEDRRNAAPAAAAPPPTTLVPDGDVMSADEAATFLGLDRKTVYGYARRGQIPHRQVGRRILLSRSALVAWLSACKAASNRKGK